VAKIAIIGTGISGLGAAYLLHRSHDITVYEKASRPGGHTRTVAVRYGDADISVDTGFIVFNQPNYPHFSAMLRHLGVAVQKSDMTFAATIRDGWFEWGARDLNTVFGQRRNLLRPAFYLVCRDVLRFNANARRTVDEHPGLTVAALIAKLKLGEWFRRYYLLPMAGAIWSCSISKMLQFPAESLVRFFENHGLLATSGQPQWYTVTDGSQNYIRSLITPFACRIRTNCGVIRVARGHGDVSISDETGKSEVFDHVVFACHGDEALRALGDATPIERQLLGAFRYQENQAILHKDVSVMPKRKRCWASWVYRSNGHGDDAAISVSYWMNRLQGIDSSRPIFVTLNTTQPTPEEHVFDRHSFMHPIFDAVAIAAQSRVQAMQGQRNTWFCGAHLRHGFHEDGLWSAVVVASKLGAAVPWAVTPELQRAPTRRPFAARAGARRYAPAEPVCETAFSAAET
jgi:predicted NAD/FAD-binding protein